MSGSYIHSPEHYDVFNLATRLCPENLSTFSMDDLSLGQVSYKPTPWNDLEASEHSGKSEDLLPSEPHQLFKQI